MLSWAGSDINADDGAEFPLRISVILPVYNSGKYLQQAIQSVFATRYPHLEVLIVEDGSTDNSLSVAERIQAQSPSSVKLLRHQRGVNRGAAASRNVGVNAATGEVIAFLDADDWYLPNRFQSCIKMMEDDQSLDAVYSKARVVECQEAVQKVKSVGEMSLPEKDGEDRLFRQLLVENSCWHINSIVCRASFLKNRVGKFNERLPLGQDLELWLRASLVGKFARDKEESPVAVYRRHEGNRYQGGFSLSGHQTNIQVYGSTLRWMRSNNIEKEYIEMLEEWITSSTFRRTDIWVAKGRNDIARRLVYLLGREYPQSMLKKRYWGNALKAMRVAA